MNKTYALTRRGLLTSSLGLAAITAVSACSAPGSSSQSNTSSPAAGSAKKDLGTDPITLVLYDGAGLKPVDDALIAGFTKLHPNVKVETRFDPDNVQATNAPRVIASATPPDLARIVALSDIVKGGLLTPLTEWSKLYGWDKIPAGQLAQYTVSEDGVRGTGTQYTVASGFTMTGVYYNKQLLTKLGVQPPKTVAEFESVLAKAKENSIVPMVAGNKSGQAATPMQFLLNNAMGAEAVNGWIFHVKGASIENAEATKALTTLEQWVAKGYFHPETNGLDANQAIAEFTAGKALFYCSGNWDAAALDKNMGDKVGFIAPPVGESGKPLAMSDPLTNFGIPAKAKNKDAAAAFLDYLMSDDAKKIVMSNGFAPSGAGQAPATSDPETSVKSQVQRAFTELVAANGQVNFIQNATNGATAEWNSQLQLLVAGRAKAADVLKAVQSKYAAEVGA